MVETLYIPSKDNMPPRRRGTNAGRPRKYGEIDLARDEPENPPRALKTRRLRQNTPQPLQEVSSNIQRRPGRPQHALDQQPRRSTRQRPQPSTQIDPPIAPVQPPQEQTEYKIAHRPHVAKEVVYGRVPPLLEQQPCVHCGALFWPNERPNPPHNKKRAWPCRSNGEVDIAIPDAPLDELGPDASQRDESIHRLDRMIYDTVDIGGVLRLTDRCKEFRKNILSYNNALAWASEGVDKVDHAVGHFNFRLQGEMRHHIGGLVPRQGEDPKFAMIYCVDGSQQQIDARLLHNTSLHCPIVDEVQHLLTRCNPFATSFRTCLQRQLDDEHSSQTRIVLRQLDPRRTERGTHNKPTSNEVAAVVSGLNNLDGRSTIERDIVVQTHDGILQRVPFWHSSYMALRYPLIFPYGEVSWQKDVALASYNRLPDDHLLAFRNRQPGVLYNHGQRFEPEAPAEENVRQDVKRGRGGTVRVTSRAWYRKAIQVSKI